MFTRPLKLSAAVMIGALAVAGQPAHATDTPATEPATAEWSIVNGRRIAEDTYPELVQLLIPRPSGKRQMCTATIVNERWVLTAAHCFDGINDDAKPGVLTYFHRDEHGEPTPREFAGETFFVHPWFRLKNAQYPTWGNEYDVALVRMAEPIVAPAGEALPTANLVGQHESIPTSGSAIAAGRGTYKFRVNPRNRFGGKYVVDPLTMREAEVPITRCKDSRQVCMNEELSPDSFPYIPDNVSLHGRWHRQPSVCFGDSGGPLFIYDGNVRKQVGIANLMPASPELQTFYELDICGRTQVLYTSVAFVQPWIQRVMQANLRAGDRPPTFPLPAPPVGGTASAHPHGWDDDGLGEWFQAGPAPGEADRVAKAAGKRVAVKPTIDDWTPPPIAEPSAIGSWSGSGDRPVAIEEDRRDAYVWTPPRTGEAEGSELAIAMARLRVSSARARGATFKPNRALLASERHMADALASGPLQAKASLYLTQPDTLEASVLAELKATGIDEVWILGGPKAISPAVEDALVKAGIKTRRLAGADRTETARVIAEVMEAEELSTTDRRFLARAFGVPGHEDRAWADSLALGVLAAKEQVPVLLTASDALSAAAESQLQGGRVVSIVGGTQAVSAGVETKINTVTGRKPTRVAGATRAQTAVAVRSQFPNPQKVIVIDGDATHGWQLGFVLAGLGADLNAPVVLTNGQTVPAETQAVLRGVPADKVLCFGPSQTCAAVLSYTR